MGFGVETIGNHDFKSCGNGMVSVTLNNGNMGACLVDEKTAEALKEKYRKSEDKLELSTKKSENTNSTEKSEDTGFFGWLKNIENKRQEGAKAFQMELVERNGGADKVLSTPLMKYTNPALYQAAKEMKDNESAT